MEKKGTAIFFFFLKNGWKRFSFGAGGGRGTRRRWRIIRGGGICARRGGMAFEVTVGQPCKGQIKNTL